MDKQKLFTLLYVILIVGILAFMGFMYNWMQTESKQCLADPVRYFVEKNPDAECSCYKIGERFMINDVQIPISTENYLKK